MEAQQSNQNFKLENLFNVKNKGKATHTPKTIPTASNQTQKWP
jgi:hypothetical protein